MHTRPGGQGALARLALVAVLGATAWPGGLNAAAPVWNRVDTPNFVVIGTGSEKSLTETGLQFEGFREALSRIVSPTATATAVPTIVIVFPNDKMFEPFRPVYNGKHVDLDGLFLPRQDVNFVLLGPRQTDESWRIVFHEYSHLIVNNVVPNLPPWLNEGLAEYYSSFELGRGGGQVIIGKPIGSHYQTLAREPWLSIPELIATTHESTQYNEGSRRSVFYAESWLLTHMLMDGEPDRKAKLSAYIDAIDSNLSAAAAWEKAFAGDDIANALRRYAARPTVLSRQYTLSEKIARASGERVMFPPAAAEAMFGELYLAIGDKPGAAGRFGKALELDSTSARATIGAAEAAGKPLAPAELKPSNDWLSDYLCAAAFVHSRSGTRSRAASAGVVALLEHAAERHPVPNMFGLIAEVAGDAGSLSPADIDGLRHAHDSAHARDDYSFALARALAMTGRYAEARNLLGTLIGHPHWPGAHDDALRMMRWVVQREQRANELASASTPAASNDTRESSTPSERETVPEPEPAEPERDVQPLYRELKDGEKRAEGLLESVACDTGKPAVVTVRYPDRVARYQAARLTDIEFITYQSSKSGRFACGPRVPPDHVYLTWKANPNGGETVVAVEFLAR